MLCAGYDGNFAFEWRGHRLQPLGTGANHAIVSLYNVFCIGLEFRIRYRQNHDSRGRFLERMVLCDLLSLRVAT